MGGQSSKPAPPPPRDVGREVETGDDFQYQFFPANRGLVQFQVKAANDAHVALTTELQEAGPMYEFIFGCSGNSMSVIRKNRTLPNKVVIYTPQILKADQFCGFWIQWDEKGIIYAGSYGATNPSISWIDNNPFRIMFIGVCTGYGSTGSWQITDVTTDGKPGTKYQFFPIVSDILRFKVKASQDANIALATKPNESDPMYEIIISGYGAYGASERVNAIKKSRKQGNRVLLQTEGLLSNNEFRAFWVTWERGHICAGREGDTEPFIQWKDKKPYPIFYFGVSTSYRAMGTWKIDAPPAHPKDLPHIGEEGIWINAQDGVVPPGAVIGGYDKTGEPLYVARILSGSAKYPGSLVPSRGGIITGPNTYNSTYQVLVRSPSYNWVATSRYISIPKGAFPCGQSMDGETLYVGRVHYKKHLVLGRVQPTTGYCYAPIAGEQVKFSRYEILMA